MNILELKACKEDTPNFRKQVSEHEDAVVALETTVKSLLKLSKASVELSAGNWMSGMSRPCIPALACWTHSERI